jgi:hypothetical protein
MLIIGCDFHTRYQQIAMMDEAGGPLSKLLVLRVPRARIVSVELRFIFAVRFVECDNFSPVTSYS